MTDARDEWRRKSVTAEVAHGIISGFAWRSRAGCLRSWWTRS